MRRRWSADADHPHLVARAGSGRRGVGTLSLGLRRMVASGPPGARTSLALADGQPPLTHDLRHDRSTYLTRNRDRSIANPRGHVLAPVGYAWRAHAGPLRPYVGIGAGTLVPHVEAQSDAASVDEYQWFRGVLVKAELEGSPSEPAGRIPADPQAVSGQRTFSAPHRGDLPASDSRARPLLRLRPRT